MSEPDAGSCVEPGQVRERDNHGVGNPREVDAGASGRPGNAAAATSPASAPVTITVVETAAPCATLGGFQVTVALSMGGVISTQPVPVSMNSWPVSVAR